MGLSANGAGAEVVRLTPEVVEGFVFEAVSAFNEGRFADAQVLLEALFILGHPTATSLWLHALCAAEQGQVASAEISFSWAEQLIMERGAAGQPDGYELLRRAADARLQSLRSEEAQAQHPFG